MMDTMAAADPYTSKGTTYNIMPIPPIAEHCHDIPAGPVKFVLESRLLNADVISAHSAQYDSDVGAHLEADGGASLHVFGAEDGLEHLRFDCFEKQPHYHYVRNAEQLNQILTIDEVAIDPITWTISCVRDRLPEMLDYAGAAELAGAVREHRAEVAQGVAKVTEMIGRIAS